jgi:LL-diaminopimelate aminotransferase
VKELGARRLSRIPPYLFAELDRLKARTRGDVIDFGVGDPDQPTPQPIIRALTRALADPANHRYPTYEGLLKARVAAADWYRTRFGVRLDPETEVCMLLGSKEGVGHLIWALCGSGDRVAIPDPSYMIYRHQTLFAGARPVVMPLRDENDFLVDFTGIPELSRLKLMLLNYPGNPTAGVATRAFYAEAVRLAHRHDFYLVNDNVYSELYFERRPISLLEIPGARERCVEFHSLSKTYNMTGWRIGFVVGNAAMIKALLRIKQNTDSGPFQAIQEAAVHALRHGERFAAANRRRYRERRDALVRGLKRLGWDVRLPEATFYVWARIPFGEDSFDYTRWLLHKHQILVTPGIGMGRFGEGYVRFALTVPKARIRQALDRLAKENTLRRAQIRSRKYREQVMGRVPNPERLASVSWCLGGCFSTEGRWR